LEGEDEMAQLKMYWMPGQPIEKNELPEGYSISNYKSEADKMPWVECCKNGLVSDTATEEKFDDCILSRVEAGLDPYKDVFFIDYNGEHVGTVTAFIHKSDNTGDMHMVGIRTDFRGVGLSKYLTQIMLEHLDGRCKFIHLTTDDWRKPAVKGYLRGGFLPVIYDVWMERRWQSLVNEFGIDSLQTLNNDTTPYKVLHKQQKIRFGAFGKADAEFINNYCKTHNDAELVAIYDAQGGDGVIDDINLFIAQPMDAIIIPGRGVIQVTALRSGLNIVTTEYPCQHMECSLSGLGNVLESTAHAYACVKRGDEKALEAFIKRTMGDKSIVTILPDGAKEFFNIK